MPALTPLEASGGAGARADEVPGRVVIAHDNLYWFGGAERIAAEIAAAFPGAAFWTFLGRDEVARRMGIEDRHRPLLPENRVTLGAYKAMAPLYPVLARVRPLPAADLLVSSSFAFAHHFSTTNHAPHLCYCYSPIRAAWSMTEEYGRDLGWGRLGARAAELAARAMRRSDRRAARRVTEYVAESRYVADQIRRFYGRTARVIYPPVDCERFRPSPQGGHDGYFLFSGRLVEAYKRPAAVVDAFRSVPHQLVVAGDGPARAALERRAGRNVEFVGHVGDSELRSLMQRCAAVIFPSRDDFGLVPIETMACGRPVLAFAAGGALETVLAGTTGEFFTSQDATAIRAAVQAFDPDSYDPAAIRAHAEHWRVERFADELRAAAAELVARTHSPGG